MKQPFILGKLSEVMGWDNDQATQEFAWLTLMAEMKYDGYQDYRAGARFIESLTDWLQQFPSEKRSVAYHFVRRTLIYVSPPEMNHLVELFYPETVHQCLLQEVASQFKLKTYQVLADEAGRQRYQTLLRKSLFMELSDGARIDVFRRANAGVVNNEQVVTGPRIVRAKWDDLLQDLRKALKDADAKFAFVFLVDDFVASGTTLIRLKDNKWGGKLVRFWNDLHGEGIATSHFDPNWRLCVHHYLATHQAKETIEDRHQQLIDDRRTTNAGWFSNVSFTMGAGGCPRRCGIWAGDQQR